jgi:hypothetical protein
MSSAANRVSFVMARILQPSRDTNGGSLMRALLASLLALALQTAVSSSVHAFPIPFAIDLTFPFEAGPQEGALEGSFRDAGSFQVESSLLPARGNALISFGQISDFSLRLPDFVIGPDLLSQGSCLTAAQLPVCGFLFSDGRLQGLVGQFSMPTSNPSYAFRLDNSSGNFFNPGAIFQSASIDNLDLGVTVASGFVTVRPIPEPLSTLLFAAGAGIVGLAGRQRSRRRSRP